MTGAESYDLPRLRRLARPYRIHWAARVGSTNDLAARLHGTGQLRAPAIVVSGRQLAGRGRGKNSWWSDRGCITATFVVPTRPERAAHQIPLIAGLAVRNALADICADPAIELKWPNDLMYGGRKLAGLLCERVAGVDLIGLGLNVNPARQRIPANLLPRITSLAYIAGRALDKTGALLDILGPLHRMVSQADKFPFSDVLKQYDRHHALRGRRVTVLDAGVHTKVSGLCHGLDNMGRLLVRDGTSRLRHVVSGQVLA